MPFVIITDELGEIKNRHVGYNPGDEKKIEEEIINLISPKKSIADSIKVESEKSNKHNIPSIN